MCDLMYNYLDITDNRLYHGYVHISMLGRNHSRVKSAVNTFMLAVNPAIM